MRLSDNLSSQTHWRQTHWRRLMIQLCETFPVVSHSYQSVATDRVLEKIPWGTLILPIEFLMSWVSIPPFYPQQLRKKLTHDAHQLRALKEVLLIMATILLLPCSIATFGQSRSFLRKYIMCYSRQKVT